MSLIAVDGGFQETLLGWYEGHQRSGAAEKAQKVALTACMHKLLTILNAMLNHRTSWEAPSCPYSS